MAVDRDRPILSLGRSTTEKRRNAPSQPVPPLKKPGFGTQKSRLEPKFERLRKILEARRVELRDGLAGAAAETAIVLEIRGTVDDFYKAVGKTEDLEWLAEARQDTAEADDDPFVTVDRKGRQRRASARVFLVMADQRGIQQLLSLWGRYRDGKPFARGFAPWRRVFEQLYELRLWGAQDRFIEAGIVERWEEELTAGSDRVVFEIDLWWHGSAQKRGEKARRAIEALEAVGGSVLHGPLAFESIAYHGLLAELPRQSATELLEKVLEGDHTAALIQCEDIMFFRPAGQADLDVVDELGSEPLDRAVEAVRGPSNPRVALLDGLPLQQHRALAGFVDVDDPEGMEATYPTSARAHGTAMASIILHGDVVERGPLVPGGLYARAVLEPNDTGDDEVLPGDKLAIDLVHRAVRRLAVGEAGGRPVAPSARIINLSVGDRCRQFDTRMISPWARLLDWLSWEHKLLFVVAAGNHGGELDVDVSEAQLRDLDDAKRAQLKQKVLDAVGDQRRLRRLRSPAEAVNALSVGALHADVVPTSPRLGVSVVDPLPSEYLPSTITAFGFGYRRSVKPDLVEAGGRQPLRVDYGNGPERTTRLVPRRGTQVPLGVRAAHPGESASLAGTCFSRGTSTATALMSRTAAFAMETIERLREENELDLDPACDPVLTRALVAHSASWTPLGKWREFVRAKEKLFYRDEVARAAGYGLPDIDRVLSCTEHRATAVSTGVIVKDVADVYEFPLPPSLVGVKTAWRLITTLSWFTPVNARHFRYRKAALWVDADIGGLDLSTRDVVQRMAQRGTLEHLVWEAEGPTVFRRDRKLKIAVNCREDAPKLTESVPYGLAVTLEVAPGSGVPVYQEVRTRLRPRLRGRAT